MIREPYRVKENMLPLSVRKEWSFRLRLPDILFLLPTATSYMTRRRFVIIIII